MPGERGLDRDFGGLQVADFANQDFVGVLPQDGPQALGEVLPMEESMGTWMMPSMSYSMGSSVVMSLSRMSFSSLSAE